jgi:hypothetical protein
MAALPNYDLSLMRGDNMTSPKKAIVIFGTAIDLESRDDTKGSLEICPKGNRVVITPLLILNFFILNMIVCVLF